MLATATTTETSRYDHQIIADWVAPDSRVIDLGCGNGALMQHLQQSKNVSGYGVEIDPAKIPMCINNGISVHAI